MNGPPTMDDVDGLFTDYAKPGSPGCAVAVIRAGDIIYERGYGLANLELSVPITPATVFNIGSMSKQFTAFDIALLEADGRLSLNDDIRTYLPEMHDFGETIAVRHLIHHTSGLRGTFPELLALAEWRDTDTTTTEDVFWLLKAQRELNFRPGTEYQYVNSNYVMLALICERVSERPFAAFCRERIFDPLGMRRSLVNDSCFKLIPGRASGYYDDGEGNWCNAPLTDSVVGPTNVYTTIEDLARWDANFSTGAVGGKNVVARMTQPGQLDDGTAIDYAFGLMVGPTHRHLGWEVVEHGEGQGGYGSWMIRFPELRLSVVVLFNLFLWDMRDYAMKVADLFVGEKTAPQMIRKQETEREATPPVELSMAQLEAKVGTYFNARRAALRRVTRTDTGLQFEGHALVPRSENAFFFEVEPQTSVAFDVAEDGTVTGVKTLTPSGDHGHKRVEATFARPDLLDQYAGRYYSPELDITWTVVADDDHLTARRRKYVDSTLTPVFADAFSDDWGPLMDYPTTYLVVFERDAGGAVSGLRVSGTRVRNLRFVRQGA